MNSPRSATGGSGQRHCWSPGRRGRWSGTTASRASSSSSDAPVLQMLEQLPDVHRFFASCLPVVAEQVFDVPKIILENIPSRRFCREPQLAEQLVEVPTVLSLSFAER